mgnify:CR=1 FL=1
MLKIFPLMEAARSGGDLRNLGGSDKHIMEFECPEGVVRFKLEAFRKLNYILLVLLQVVKKLRKL